MRFQNQGLKTSSFAVTHGRTPIVSVHEQLEFQVDFFPFRSNTLLFWRLTSFQGYLVLRLLQFRSRLDSNNNPARSFCATSNQLILSVLCLFVLGECYTHFPASSIECKHGGDCLRWAWPLFCWCGLCFLLSRCATLTGGVACRPFWYFWVVCFCCVLVSPCLHHVDVLDQIVLYYRLSIFVQLGLSDPTFHTFFYIRTVP